MDAKKESEQQKSLLAIRAETESKIRLAKSKRHLDQKEVYDITKTFFRELLQLKYEFTHEELIEELQKIYLDKNHHEKIKTFIKKIGMMEYTNKTYSDDELNEMLDEMTAIITILIRHHSKKTILHKIMTALGIYRLKRTPSTKDTTEAKEELFRLLRIVEDETDIEKAKHIYSKSLEQYNHLTKEEKEKYYQDLMKTYNKLNTK